MELFKIEWTIFDIFANSLEFNWFEKYHHILAIIILCTLILLFALTLNKNSYTVRYINYISFASLIVLLVISPIHNINITSTLWFNDDLLYLAFYLIGGIFIALTLLNISDLSFVKENKEIEFPMLILMGFLATVLLIGSTNLISVFISLECLAFLSYVLVAFERSNKLSAQAGVRYLFLGAVPTGLFVLGIVELYSFLGTFNLDDAEKLIYGSNEMSRIHYYITNQFENFDYVLYDVNVELCQYILWMNDIMDGSDSNAWRLYMGRLNDRLYYPNEIDFNEANIYEVNDKLKAFQSPELATDEIVMHELNDVLTCFKDNIKEKSSHINSALGNIITYRYNPLANVNLYTHYGNRWLTDMFVIEELKNAYKYSSNYGKLI
jgi:hypothetical protein